jgi:anti-anti-sigma regulatory factor
MPDRTDTEGDLSRFVALTTAGGVLTATFTGPAIGRDEAPAIASTAIGALQRAGSRLQFLVLDFSRVTFINSAGLGMCIELRNRANAQGAASLATGLNDDLTTVFNAMKIDRLIEVVDGGDELARRLKSG